MKTLKESAICAVVIFVFNVLLKLIFDPGYLKEFFEHGMLAGIGWFLFAFVFLFLAIFMIMSIVRFIAKLRKSKANRP